jgi:hypothetical protein
MKKEILEQVSYFNYLSYHVSYNNGTEVRNRILWFSFMCDTIKRTLKRTWKDMQMKFYNTTVVSVSLYGCEMWITWGGDKKTIAVF